MERWTVGVAIVVARRGGYRFVLRHDLPAGCLSPPGASESSSLRVCVILMKDERGNPVAQVSDIVDELQAAIDIFKQEANVRLIRSAPFQYDSGFAGNETATADTSPSSALK